MSDGNAAAWVSVAISTLEVVGGIVGALGGCVMLLARRTFATREDVDQRFAAHLGDHQKLEQRMVESDNRLMALKGSIDMVGAASQQAMEAANDAKDAADKMTEVHVNLASLRGDIKTLEAAIKPIERLTMDMVEGHMSGGLGGRNGGSRAR